MPITKDEAASVVLAPMTGLMVLFHALRKKGVITYQDMQDELSGFREHLPAAAYTKEMADVLNILEQSFQAGPYRSPLDPT